MNKIKKLVVTLIFFLLLTPTLDAGVPVIDWANTVQTTVTAIKAVAAVEHQVSQITNQIQNLQYKIQSLRTMGSDAFSQVNSILDGNLSEVNSLLNNVKGMGYTMESVSNEFDTLFPNEKAWNETALGKIGTYFDKWQTAILDSTEVSMSAQTVVSKVKAHNEEAKSILSRTKGADGEVRQLQATNQMLSVVSSQLSGLTQIMGTHSRMMATAKASGTSRSQASRKAAKKAMEGYTETEYDPPKYNELPKMR